MTASNLNNNYLTFFAFFFFLLSSSFTPFFFLSFIFFLLTTSSSSLSVWDSLPLSWTKWWSMRKRRSKSFWDEPSSLIQTWPGLSQASWCVCQSSRRSPQQCSPAKIFWSFDNFPKCLFREGEGGFIINCNVIWWDQKKYLLIRQLLGFLEHVLVRGKVIIQIIKHHQLSNKLFNKTDEGFNQQGKGAVLWLENAVFIAFDNHLRREWNLLMQVRSASQASGQRSRC